MTLDIQETNPNKPCMHSLVRDSSNSINHFQTGNRSRLDRNLYKGTKPSICPLLYLLAVFIPKQIQNWEEAGPVDKHDGLWGAGEPGELLGTRPGVHNIEGDKKRWRHHLFGVSHEHHVSHTSFNCLLTFEESIIACSVCRGLGAMFKLNTGTEAEFNFRWRGCQIPASFP